MTSTTNRQPRGSLGLNPLLGTPLTDQATCCHCGTFAHTDCKENKHLNLKKLKTIMVSPHREPQKTRRRAAKQKEDKKEREPDKEPEDEKEVKTEVAADTAVKVENEFGEETEPPRK